MVGIVGAPWLGWGSLAILLALAVICLGVTLAALLGAPPMVPLRDRSHLFLRLSWLGRYGTAAVILALSTFLGGLAGSRAEPLGDNGALMGLLGEIVRYAAIVGLSIFALWLTIDLWRLGTYGRRAGVQRTLRWIGRPYLDKWAHHPAVTRWVDVFTNPVMGAVAIIMTAGTLLWPLVMT